MIPTLSMNCARIWPWLHILHNNHAVYLAFTTKPNPMLFGPECTTCDPGPAASYTLWGWVLRRRYTLPNTVCEKVNEPPQGPWFCSRGGGGGPWWIMGNQSWQEHIQTIKPLGHLCKLLFLNCDKYYINEHSISSMAPSSKQTYNLYNYNTLLEWVLSINVHVGFPLKHQQRHCIA